MEIKRLSQETKRVINERGPREGGKHRWKNTQNVDITLQRAEHTEEVGNRR